MSIAKILNTNSCDNEIYSVSPQLFISNNKYHRHLKQYTSQKSLNTIINNKPIVTPSIFENNKSSLNSFMFIDVNIASNIQETIENEFKNNKAEEINSFKKELFQYELENISSFNLDSNE